MPTSPFAEVFTLVERVPSADGDGNDLYADGDLTTVYGVFAPQGSTELVQGQQTVLTHDTVYLNNGAPVPAATDQVIARGLRFDIDGFPEVYVNGFTGDAPGPVLRLLRVTG